MSSIRRGFKIGWWAVSMKAQLTKPSLLSKNSYCEQLASLLRDCSEIAWPKVQSWQHCCFSWSLLSALGVVGAARLFSRRSKLLSIFGQTQSPCHRWQVIACMLSHLTPFHVYIAHGYFCLGRQLTIFYREFETRMQFSGLLIGGGQQARWAHLLLVCLVCNIRQA